MTLRESVGTGRPELLRLMVVPLIADSVASPRLVYGGLELSDTGEMDPAYPALYLVVAGSGDLGRVTFEGLDAIRGSRGEYLPFDDQYRVRVAEVLSNVPAEIITHAVCFPDRLVEQPLHPVRAVLARRFGQRPPVLARQRGEQPHQIGPGPPAWLDPPEPDRDPRHQVIEPCRPTRKIFNRHKGESLQWMIEPSSTQP